MKIAILIFIFAVPTFSQTFNATVVSVSDGDTITIRHSDGNADRVRMLGLDAPEIAHNSKEISQPFGDFCKILLASKLAEAKAVTVQSVKRDNYGRILGRVLADGEDVNLFVLKNGCAWLYYPNGIPPAERLLYEQAFIAAQSNKVGLFSNSRAVTPKVWRKHKHLKFHRK